VFLCLQCVNAHAVAGGATAAQPIAAEIAIGDQPGNASSALALPGRPDRTGDELAWRWSRFSTSDYVITGVGGAMTLAAAIIKPVSKPAISGGILFDDDLRKALRPDGIQTRYTFRDASDVGLSLTVTWPFFVDSLVTAWWYRGSREVGQETALIDLEALAISGAAQGITNVLVGRERPYGRDCGSPNLPNSALDCQGSTRYRSFFSGHSTFSFTGAALICIHHFKNELLGSPWDALSCAGGYAVAASTATFRVVSDVHYASDVIIGALVGTLIGYGVPLLHYRAGAAANARAGGVTVQLVPAPGGIAVLGVF
jgi:membrane-associated phospholipid phosphatase